MNAHHARRALLLIPRGRCLDCTYHQPRVYRCANDVAARLLTDEVGPALATLPQHCPGYRPRGDG